MFLVGLNLRFTGNLKQMHFVLKKLIFYANIFKKKKAIAFRKCLSEIILVIEERKTW